MKFIIDETEDKKAMSEAKKGLRKQYIQFLNSIENPKKEAWNPFTKSKYADLSAVLRVVTKAQKDIGVSMIQEVESDGNTIACHNSLISEYGEIEFKPFTIVASKNSQELGSAESYARRYSLIGICGIAGEDDDGNASTNYQSSQSSNYRDNRSNNYQGSNYNHSNYNQRPQQQSSQSNNQPTQVTDKQNKLMLHLTNEISGFTKESVKDIGHKAMKTAQVQDYNNMTRHEASQVINLLTNQLKKETKEKEGSK